MMRVTRSAKVLVISVAMAAAAGTSALAQQAPSDERVYDTPIIINNPTPPAFPFVPPAVQTQAALVVETTTTAAPTTTRLVAVAGVQVVNPAPAAAPVAENTQVLGTSLERPVAFTGANSKPLVMSGIALTGVGAVLLLGARRRKQAPASKR